MFCFFVILRLRLWQNIHIQNLPNYLSYNNNNYYYLMYNKYYYFWQSLAGRPRLTILRNYFVRNTANLASRGKLFLKSKLFLVTNLSHICFLSLSNAHVIIYFWRAYVLNSHLFALSFQSDVWGWVVSSTTQQAQLFIGKGTLSFTRVTGAILPHKLY